MFKFKLSHAVIPIKVILLFFLLFIMQAQLMSQEKKVILSVRETTVKQFFDEIQRQTEYNITIDWNRLMPDKRVMVSSNVLSVKDLLIQLLQNTGYTYEINNNDIAIIPTSIENPFPSSFAKEVSDLYSGKNQVSVVKNNYWESESGCSGSAKALMLYFRVNSFLLERDYKDNAKTLAVLNQIFSDRELFENMDYITISAAASPEGDAENNEKLAMNRALAIKSYIMWKHPYVNRDGIVTFSVGEDWSGLKKMVEDDYSVPARAEVLAVLDAPLSGEDKKTSLMRLNGGKSYTYIKSEILPYLRGGVACLIFFKSKSSDQSAQNLISTSTTAARIDTVYLKERVSVLDTMCIETTEVVERDTIPNKFYMALKTNILYDALLLPNLAVEFYIPGRWSVEIEGDWSWWNTGSKEKYWRIQSAGVELRKWMGKRYKNRPLNGHYLGLYGMGGTYDVKLEERGYLSDWSYSVGLSYGYSLPIAKRLNLEFGLALGYLGGEYKDYHYDQYYDDFPWERTRQRHYFGPTKAKASLVWLIGSGVNQKKNNKKVSNQ